MANPFFRFKQFTVYHDRCAMKVGIDGVLLGCWTNVAKASTVLDIGTGTGLIALMIAQRTDAHIDSIDIDEGAFEQAIINVQASPWSSRLNVVLSSLQDFVSDKKYDLIVSNPPYFVNSLKNPNEQRTTARHTDSLTHEELIDQCIPKLTEGGRICLILPIQEGLSCVEYAQTKGLCCNKLTKVFPKPAAEAKRLLIELSFRVTETHQESLIIETDRHVYSPEFSLLAKDYYLKL